MEKPLHVRVAEALGWRECMPFSVYEVVDPETWTGDSPVPDPKSISGYVGGFVPRYDTDWSATGPLIEKQAIDLVLAWPGDFGQDGFRWIATRGADQRGQSEGITAEGATPLLAVCNLILALHEAGKLAA